MEGLRQSLLCLGLRGSCWEAAFLLRGPHSKCLKQADPEQLTWVFLQYFHSCQELVSRFPGLYDWKTKQNNSPSKQQRNLVVVGAYKIQPGVLAPAPRQQVITPCVLLWAGASAITALKQDPRSHGKLAMCLERWSTEVYERVIQAWGLSFAQDNGWTLSLGQRFIWQYPTE